MTSESEPRPDHAAARHGFNPDFVPRAQYDVLLAERQQLREALERVTRGHRMSAAVEGWDDSERADQALTRLARRVTTGERRTNGGTNGYRQAPAGPTRSAPTPQETRVLLCASHGLTNEQIGEALGCGLESVKHHLQGAGRCLAAKNRTHAVAVALREGFIR